MPRKNLPLILLFLLAFADVWGQSYTITGKVVDKQSNEGMPFVNVYFNGTISGTATNFDGFFEITADQPYDSLVVSYLGYRRQAKSIKGGKDQTINFKLERLSIGLGEVEVNAGKNPAIALMRKVIKNKSIYNKTNLDSYEYESYNKIRLAADNVSEKFKSRWIFKPLAHLFDSLQTMPGEENEAILPFYNSESISRVYKTNKPEENEKEVIEAVKLSGVGIREGDFVSNFTGTSFLDPNFYENKVLFLDKEFLSPLADGAFIFYDFYITDSMYIGQDWCYKLKVKPKNDQDLAFFGYMWVTDSTYAVRRVDFQIRKSVNINFIENALIQQEFEFTEAGPVFPMKTRIVVDFVDLSNKWVGIIAKIYLSVRELEINKTYEDDFFNKKIDRKDSALANKDSFWMARRHEQVSNDDLRVYRLIDSVNRIPRVKNLVNLAYFVLSGYEDIGPVDIGPYFDVVSLNIVEGLRLQAGFRTNENFSQKIRFEGYGAYGTEDQKFKYGAKSTYFLSRDPWTSLSLERKDDLSRGGVTFNYGNIGVLGTAQNDLNEDTVSSLKYGRVNRKVENRFKIERAFNNGLKSDITFQNINYLPLGEGKLPFRTSEIKLHARFNPGAVFFANDNRPVRVANRLAPTFILNVTQGLKDVLNSDFEYFRAGVGMDYRLRLGLAGSSQITVKADKIFSTVPYPLLGVHAGNQTPFFDRNTFALMNYFEFLSDEFVEVIWDHHFNGLFFNRIPLLRKLNLREVVWGHGVFGNLSDKNKSFNENGYFATLESQPYLEAGFGIENFLYFFRVDAIYRLTYVDEAYRTNYLKRNPNGGINTFGVKFSLSFNI